MVVCHLCVQFPLSPFHAKFKIGADEVVRAVSTEHNLRKNQQDNCYSPQLGASQVVMAGITRSYSSDEQIDMHVKNVNHWQSIHNVLSTKYKICESRYSFKTKIMHHGFFFKEILIQKWSDGAENAARIPTFFLFFAEGNSGYLIHHWMSHKKAFSRRIW